ncbi:alanine--tRNA ligase [Desulfurivibrio alkaliphilus]|uniref:Alanine--tRNA ligase n=1 Tax=Desulfurivibrio alkaliphilus (strain DSM 19089 / UNIQEM U267 / AHT2) TaxID=589865 RepID=D6Z4V7_DESAT|nr:alanine--tRNA ligase [Desulfurivibrio alkaliphilus]ADH86582.1 alanyl-tRNA synthetase [Desulfurivibrio alkaliphilus AHT 2]
MNGNEIRQRFIEYFTQRGHTLVESSPLVPHEDPTLLFTNAGMVQFKKVFTGEEKRDYSRAVTCQRCVRAGGKHNDLDNVGYTARHHTFFEMLGNFSFGDYFKEEAIRMAWDFLTKEIGLSPAKLWVSVYEDDDEAYAIWEKIEDLPPGRIVRLGEKDNFWAMGDTGPCGPCSEIHIDQGEAVACPEENCGVDCDCDRFLEIWNLVFMQYERDEQGNLTPLPKPSIDTGMGLERIAAVAQGKINNYDSDLFQPIIQRTCQLAGISYGANLRADTALRVIADHARATTFLVADGVLPSNEGRGYVLRRIMRRAVRFGRSLGLTEPFLGEVCSAVADGMGSAWGHLGESRELLGKVVRHEEERFLETLDHGLGMLASEIERLQGEGIKTIAGDFIFKLYDTYGFPVDIAKDVAQEEGLQADEEGFGAAMARQREQSRRSWKGGGLGELGPGFKELLERGVKSRFVGYETRRHHGTLVAVLDQRGELHDEAAAGTLVSLVCDETPFYAEAGGQVGDWGEIAGGQGRAKVLNTLKIGEHLVVHQAEVAEGKLAVGAEVLLAVAEGRRRQTAAHHTATHLLHAALRRVLGEHVKQAGSLVDAERLRFDFTHFSPLSREEIRRVEELVNEEIRANTRLEVATLPREEALQSGAAALFGEKYGDTVRVVAVGDFSKELCGGTHVGATGEIGLFKITSEGGIAASTRRIEGCCGGLALSRVHALEDEVQQWAGRLKTNPAELGVRLDKLLARQKELERQLAELAAKASRFDAESVLRQATEVNGIKVATCRLEVDSVKTLREAGDKLRDKMGSGIAVLAAEPAGKVSLLALVSKDLTDRYRAGDIVKQAAQLVGGSGGGRPDMAQAGGGDPEKIDHALAAVPGIVAEL